MSILNENRAPFRETTLFIPRDSREVVNVLTHTSNVPLVVGSLPQRNPHGGICHDIQVPMYANWPRDCPQI